MPGQRVAFDIAKKKEAIIWIRVHGGGVASRAEAHFRAKGWRRVPEEVVMSSIYGCGFDDDFKEWFISKHDVYGDLFRPSGFSVTRIQTARRTSTTTTSAWR
ncbi:hypothetical protein Pcac1_g9827 [Phytophthora cactorum]|nr:hypothetical protein Pcac1_g9827 [Phytophthora cactorum]KAG4060359.1 hypothetical protein PC123_g4733 [Phytophthora cactorum]